MSKISRSRNSRTAAQVRSSALPGKAPIVILGTVDYSFPYRQRCQHLAKALAEIGHPVFYVSPRTGHDTFIGSQVIAERLCLVDEWPAAWTDAVAPAFLLMSTHNQLDDAMLREVRTRTDTIVYDYIDHIDPRISLGPVPLTHLQAHNALLADASVICVCTATLLRDEVHTIRGSSTDNLLFVPNGVDVAHFNVSRSPPSDPNLATVVGEGRPIAGYFGALASWVDYDLIESIACECQEVNFVVIGPDYDGSFAAWLRTRSALPPNLHFLPAVAYQKLPASAAWFDVALIPFVVNEITLATSPLKLYEYFALGAPVVSTRLPECAKHQPQVILADTAQDSAQAIRRALSLRNDQAYIASLAVEAAKHDWTSRARQIATGIEQLRRDTRR